MTEEEIKKHNIPIHICLELEPAYEFYELNKDGFEKESTEFQGHYVLWERVKPLIEVLEMFERSDWGVAKDALKQWRGTDGEGTE